MSVQDQPPQDNSTKPLSRKELKKREKQLSKELGPADTIWLNDEVPDIITPDERRAFLELSTNEERDTTTSTVLVPITVQLRNRDLSFQSNQGLYSAVLDLYGRITDPGGRVIQTFEDLISRDFPESPFQASLDLSSIYQKSVPLRSGLYRLDVVIKDTHSGNVGTLWTALRVPSFEPEKLDASSLILADEIEPVSTAQIAVGQFVLGAYKVRPRLSQEFSVKPAPAKALVPLRPSLY